MGNLPEINNLVSCILYNNHIAVQNICLCIQPRYPAMPVN